MVKSDLFIRALLLDRILVTEKTTRTPRVHLVIIKVAELMHEHVNSCLHLIIVNTILFISLFYVYVYFIYNH